MANSESDRWSSGGNEKISPDHDESLALWRPEDTVASELSASDLDRAACSVITRA